METHFACPKRCTPEEVAVQNEAVTNHPVVSGMLSLVSGMLAILNRDRQVVALNDQLADYLGIENLSAAFGLQPGEAVSCIHAHDMPAGCGTGPYCSSCGAAVSIVTSLNTDKPDSRKCALEITGNGKKHDLFLQVQSIPIEVEGQPFLLLFLQDISAQQKWAAMEQVFFHDINNILAGVVSVSNLLLMESTIENRDMVQQLFQSSRRIAQEVAIQRYLLSSDSRTYTPIWSNVSLQSVFDELATIFDTHPAAQGKSLSCPRDVSTTMIKTDYSLLLRVLNNMLVNAFEATPSGGTVLVECVEKAGDIRFTVWNEGEIPVEIQQRLFQRNVSTKEGLGRGIGTFSMKLFGEEILGGKIDFESSSDKGTTFRFILSREGNSGVVSNAPANIFNR